MGRVWEEAGSLPSGAWGLAPRENFEIYVNVDECKTGESMSMMVWPTLSRTAKEQNGLHAKHESGLIVTDVLWSLGLLVTTVSPAKVDELIEMLFGG